MRDSARHQPMHVIFILTVISVIAYFNYFMLRCGKSVDLRVELVAAVARG
jgi:hypothetical protein